MINNENINNESINNNISMGNRTVFIKVEYYQDNETVEGFINPNYVVAFRELKAIYTFDKIGVLVTLSTGKTLTVDSTIKEFTQKLLEANEG